MSPFDPRLARYARASRSFLVLTVGLGVMTAALLAGQAAAVAHGISPLVQGTVRPGRVVFCLSALAVLFCLRAAVAGAQERYGRRSGRRVVAELREQILRRTLVLGPRWLDGGHGVDTVALVTRELDALGPYFEGYLPQLILSVTVTPALLVLVLYLDPVCGALIALTLPLIPLFMVLIGRFTRRETVARLETLKRLSAQLLDLLAGLPTLRLLGRAGAPLGQVRALGEAHRHATMQTLSRAFLSSLALELLTTLSVAAVAVSIGLRLVHGTLDLTTGLFVLLLAPEVFLPLRQVGAQFHASADGAAAAERSFKVLETPLPAQGADRVSDLEGMRIELCDVDVQSAASSRCAPRSLALTLDLSVPSVVALVGGSGAGKSTALAVLLGWVAPTSGRVRVRHGGSDADVDLGTLERSSLWSRIAWLPQRPSLVPGTVLENILRGRSISPEKLAGAARDAGFDAVVRALPQGWDTRVGQGGNGLSLGQRQRLALTRVLVGDERLVLLDEPTAHLDAEGEASVLAAIRALPSSGRSVVMVTHRASARAIADRVVEVFSTPLQGSRLTGLAVPVSA